MILARIGTPQEAAVLTPYIDIAILAPARGHTIVDLADVVTGAAAVAGTPVTLLVGGAVGDLLGLPAMAGAIETATDVDAAGVAVHVDPVRVDEAIEAVSGLGLAAPEAAGTLAEALGIDLPLGGRAA